MVLMRSSKNETSFEAVLLCWNEKTHTKNNSTQLVSCAVLQLETEPKYLWWKSLPVCVITFEPMKQKSSALVHLKSSDAISKIDNFNILFYVTIRNPNTALPWWRSTFPPVSERASPAILPAGDQAGDRRHEHRHQRRHDRHHRRDGRDHHDQYDSHSCPSLSDLRHWSWKKKVEHTNNKADRHKSRPHITDTHAYWQTHSYTCRFILFLCKVT